MPASAISNTLISVESRADIQGFVTSGFKHLPCAAYLFLHLGERKFVKEWLGRVLPGVTTAASWRISSALPKQRPVQALNVGFTVQGLRACGLPETCITTFPPEFVRGMASPEAARNLSDTGESASDLWELGGPRNEAIHAVLILHSASESELGCRCAEIETSLQETSAGRVVSKQIGVRPPSGKEPFGFRDGISQPEIKGIKETGRGTSAGEFILGYPNEYGVIAGGPVMQPADDPFGLLAESANPFLKGKRDFGLNGSFLVYRKLEQDVAGFWQFMQNESQRRLGRPDPQLMVGLASKMVGRWPSGAPLTLAPEQDNPALRDANDFYYAKNDPLGRGCPFGAHIRRCNPRDQLPPAAEPESLHMTARHRILRRGKPYGTPLFDLSVLDRTNDPQSLKTILDLKPDRQSRGIHFLGINASLKSQFEFVQQVWANNPHFNGLTNNPDPLTASCDDQEGAGSMLTPCVGLDQRTATLPRFVTVRGGAYFFLPGVRALKWLR